MDLAGICFFAVCLGAALVSRDAILPVLFGMPLAATAYIVAKVVGAGPDHIVLVAATLFAMGQAGFVSAFLLAARFELRQGG
jgi:hypothetical protein